MAKLVPIKRPKEEVILPVARHYAKVRGGGRAYARDPLHTPNKKTKQT